jgi:hypothetical protein
VPEDVNARLDVRPPGGPPDEHLDDLLGERPAPGVGEHPLAA